MSSIGDLNCDGVPDLMIGNFDSNSTTILFLNGDGTIANTSNIQNPNSTLLSFGSSVNVIADLDGDQIPEIAIGASMCDVYQSTCMF